MALSRKDILDIKSLSIILDQVSNGVAVRMAHLYLVTGGTSNADGD